MLALLLDIPAPPPDPPTHLVPWSVALLTLSAVGVALIVLTVRKRRQRPPA
jgi:hypothetical protein